MMWGDKTGNDADLAAVKPDVIIFLRVSASVARSWLKKEPVDSPCSEAEREFLTKTGYDGTFLDHHQQAYQQFMDTTNIPYHQVEVEGTVTP